jgi:arylesterase/paraoxonase
MVLSAVLLVGVVALVLRTLDALGLFTEVTHVACEDRRFISGVEGAQDVRFDLASNTLFIAATDARAQLNHPSPHDGIYVWRPGQPAPPFKLDGTSADFHPSALSLFRAADGSLTVMAVTQPAKGAPLVDIFDVTDPSTGKIALHEREAIAGDMLINPDAIAAADKSRFYVTNTQTSKTFFGRMLEIHLLLPRANVIYFDGANFRIVAEGLRVASGIALSPDGSHVYVGEMTGRELRTYARDSFSGDLSLAGELPVDSGLDNVSVEANGDLLIAGHPKLFDLLMYSRDSAKPSLSQILLAAVDRRGIPQAARAIYSGTDIGAAGVGVAVGERLLIGSGFSSKILSCALPR